jgi:uncharacterized protein (TIGR01777 family)
MKILVTGATGLIGRALTPALEARGLETIRLRRASSSAADVNSGEPSWDPSSGRLDPSVFQGIGAVIHLAGENLNGRWTTERKERIRDSRVGTTRLLCDTLARVSPRPHVLLCASAVGYYGSRGSEPLTEASSPGTGFLAELVRDWEEAAQAARTSGIRVVHLRFGVVLTPRGGALREMLTPFMMGLGARLGSGRQFLSWIALDEIPEVVLHVLDRDLDGPLNVASPNPVDNAEFTRVLARVLHRPAAFRLPAAALKLAFGQMAEETILASQRALPARLEAAGYRFRHPDLTGALRHLLGR